MSHHDRPRRGRPPSLPQFRNPTINSRYIDQGDPRIPSLGHRVQCQRLPRHAAQLRQIPETNIRLITNAYNISTSDLNHKVHEYKLSIEPSIGCRDLPPKVLSRAFVSRSIRKLIIDTIVPQLTIGNTSRGSVLIEPNLENIFTLNQFHFRDPSVEPETTSQSNRAECKFSNVRVCTDLIANLSIDLSIKYTKTFKLGINNYTTSLMSSIIHHQLLTDMLRYESVYYLSNDNPSGTMERLDLISCHLMGISISGARRANDNQTLVVINSSHSYITQAHRLIDLLASYVEGRPVQNVELRHDPNESISELQNTILPKIASIKRFSEEGFAAFCSILTGFKCRSRGFDGAAVNLRFNLTGMAAIDLYLGDGTTVYDKYKSMGINLNYPNLPCLQSRFKEQLYYPFELCTLVPGQKVPVFRLSSQARDHLLTLNKPNPNLSRANSVDARNQVVSRNKDQFESFGLKVSSAPAEAFGNTLIKPILQYKDQTVFPSRDFWESSCFYRAVDLLDNWCLVDTVGLSDASIMSFFEAFSEYASKFGFHMGPPGRHNVPKRDILDSRFSIEAIIAKCSQISKRDLRFIMFIIDSNSTPINRMIHLTFDAHPIVTATCIRSDSILNTRQHRAIYRTLVHKLNSRLGGTNFTYNRATWERLSLECSDLMIVGLDVTHPDNELSGVSIVGCAYTYSRDLFRHKSLVWPQTARKEIITKMDKLMERLLHEYKCENRGKLPHQIIIYRDGVSYEEFERVRGVEICKASKVIEEISRTSNSSKPNLSYIIAQKRHTMRFFKEMNNGTVQNPPGGTLIDQGIVPQEGREFYLYSNTSPQATARPLHYHVLLNGLGLENLQKLTYYLCFNFGKCSTSLSMPSSLRYAHNAAYDARNRVIASREFHESKFYTTKFFC